MKITLRLISLIRSLHRTEMMHRAAWLVDAYS